MYRTSYNDMRDKVSQVPKIRRFTIDLTFSAESSKEQEQLDPGVSGIPTRRDFKQHLRKNVRKAGEEEHSQGGS